MKSDEKNVEKILDRAVTRHGNLSETEVDAAMNRAWDKLQPHLGGESHGSILPPKASRRVRAFVPLAAAAAALVAVLSVVIVRTTADAVYAVVETPDAELYVSGSETRLVHAGTRIAAGEVVRSAGKNSAVLSLRDGSRVEMRAQSELTLERANDGVRIRLSKGGVIVNAASQNLGQHLHVWTKDVTVSAGTVFLVNAEEEGSRVAAIEGEASVQQGAAEWSLRPGQQRSTNPRMPSPPVKEEIAWSQHVGAHLALLEQSVPPSPAIQQSAQEARVAFEVASVRVSEGGPRGARGDIQYPCNGAGPQINPGRFAVAYVSLYRLFAWANGRDCGAVERSGLLSGGPEWIRTTPFAIQATIPAGSPSYTVQQFLRGDAPKLQQMLQTLLVERFNLKTHSESKEVSAYTLLKGKDTGRLKRSEDQTPPGVFLFSTDGTGLTRVSATAAPIAALVDLLKPMLDRPVSDKTDLKGLYDVAPFQFTVATPPSPMPMPQGTRYGIGQAQMSEILEQLGLKLESTKASMEVQVIDHVEKPSDN